MAKLLLLEESFVSQDDDDSENGGFNIIVFHNSWTSKNSSRFFDTFFYGPAPALTASVFPD